MPKHATKQVKSLCNEARYRLGQTQKKIKSTSKPNTNSSDSTSSLNEKSPLPKAICHLNSKSSNKVSLGSKPSLPVPSSNSTDSPSSNKKQNAKHSSLNKDFNNLPTNSKSSIQILHLSSSSSSNSFSESNQLFSTKNQSKTSKTQLQTFNYPNDISFDDHEDLQKNDDYLTLNLIKEANNFLNSDAETRDSFPGF